MGVRMGEWTEARKRVWTEAPPLQCASARNAVAAACRTHLLGQDGKALRHRTTNCGSQLLHLSVRLGAPHAANRCFYHYYTYCNHQYYGTTTTTTTLPPHHQHNLYCYNHRQHYHK